MPRLSRLLATGAAALLVAVPLGCGGGSKTQTETRRPPRSAEVPPPRLTSTDRRAYSRIQKTSGDLRAAAIPVTYGTAGAIASSQLNADIRKLAAVTPRSPLLKRLRTQMLNAVRSAIAPGAKGAAAKAIAAAATAEADRIDAGLRRYAASHPAANELAPG